MTESAPTPIHRIRLRGPWEWAVPTLKAAQAWTWNRIRLPDEWDRLPAIAGPVWFRRRFQAPTGVLETDRVRVLLSPSRHSPAVVLNGSELTSLPALANDTEPMIRFDIKTALSSRSNLLEIVFAAGITAPDLNGGLGQPVMIEIESLPQTA